MREKQYKYLDDLAPCPFCHNTKVDTRPELRQEPRGFRRFYIWCPYCWARGPLVPDMLDACRGWNSRKKFGSVGQWKIFLIKQYIRLHILSIFKRRKP